MSLFPSVGSTVTKVLTNKTGTTAKVIFDDGTSILVKYEALVIDASDEHEFRPSVDVTENKKIHIQQNPKISRVSVNEVKPSSAPAKKPLSESAYKELAQKALQRQQSRSEKVFSQWEHDTGQFDHPSGKL